MVFLAKYLLFYDPFVNKKILLGTHVHLLKKGILSLRRTGRAGKLNLY